MSRFLFTSVGLYDTVVPAKIKANTSHIGEGGFNIHCDKNKERKAKIGQKRVLSPPSLSFGVSFRCSVFFPSAWVA